MLSGPFLSKDWMGATGSFEEAETVMVGLPYDGTCSFKPGTRFAPQEIRTASIGIETYSPIFGGDMEELSFYDAGDLDFPFGNRDEVLSMIEKAATEVYDAGKKWLGVGGEHLVTLPAVKSCFEKYPDLAIIHFDAHADLRMEYLDEELSHSTVMRRISEFVTPENIIQFGIRSGTKEEFRWMNAHNSLCRYEKDFPQWIKRFENKPVYLTIDLDVLDPSIFPGTGTPEPGGLTYNELINKLVMLKELNIVGADVVELSPHYDPSGVSTITAAKVIREVLFLINP
ncbi:MAG: agmatinase [Candidatus Gastranaerophilales bacterium]|nr:agmatinase [Candidatus Gastranaerophilales bacterium]